MLVDTHAHLDDEDFRDDREQVLERARNMGVEQILTVGADVTSSQAAADLAARYDPVFAAVGIHPNSLDGVDEEAWQAVVALTAHAKVVAIGETGLDLYRKRQPLDRQRQWLLRHVELSRQTGLPLVIHCRDAHEVMLDALVEAHNEGPIRGVMHCFSGKGDAVETLVDLGMHISIAGPVTFPKSHALRDVCAVVPLDRLLVETDSPYLAPQVRRGRRNEPGFVRYTAQVIAEVRGMALEELAAATTRNARRLFALPDPGAR